MLARLLKIAIGRTATSINPRVCEMGVLDSKGIMGVAEARPPLT
jgi:hypothetical protein